MSKIILVSIYLFVCIYSHAQMTTQNTRSKTQTEAQKNLTAVHLINKAFRTGDTSKINTVVSPNFIDHSDRGDIGRDSLKLMIIGMYKTTKDMKTEVIKEFADKDWVFALMRYSGVSHGEIGIPDGPYEMHTMEVVRFKNGLIVEHWSYMELRDIAKFIPQMK
jgi:predicted SnoaL-like aldol condensation-catalyzing enzyme